MSAITCILLIVLINNVNALASTDPIIWHKLKNSIVKGVETVSVVVNYKSPCDLFNELMINDKSTNELKIWCENEFQNDFIKPLEDFCTDVGPKDSAKFGLIREKRFIFIDAIALLT